MHFSRCRTGLWLLLAGLTLSCDSSASGESGSATESSSALPGGKEPAQAGQLTAGTWDDNRNYSYFSGYLGAQAAVLRRLSNRDWP